MDPKVGMSRGRPVTGEKTPGSGRKKGTPNKNTIDATQKARELGIDPFEVLLLYARGDWQALGYSSEQYVSGASDHGTFYKWTIDPSVRAKCASEACQYLYPKRKAIEIVPSDSDSKSGSSLVSELIGILNAKATERKG